MKYALNLAEDGRILSATFERFAAQNSTLVNSLPDGDINNYLYQDNQYIYSPIESLESSSTEQRENAYNTEAIIEWDNKMITITQAAQLWQYYAAEGNKKSNELTVLIVQAKELIRKKYPD